LVILEGEDLRDAVLVGIAAGGLDVEDDEMPGFERVEQAATGLLGDRRGRISTALETTATAAPSSARWPPGTSRRLVTRHLCPFAGSCHGHGNGRSPASKGSLIGKD